MALNYVNLAVPSNIQFILSQRDLTKIYIVQKKRCPPPCVARWPKFGHNVRKTIIGMSGSPRREVDPPLRLPKREAFFPPSSGPDPPGTSGSMTYTVCAAQRKFC